MGPHYNEDSANEAYEFIMGYLSEMYSIQKFPTDDSVWKAIRLERNDRLKEALHKLFELDSWEGF